ncbi:leukocyte receptor cluster member 1 [Electrophorus electricus]|uniref:CBF1-interacting co-repressor CIR N-terminal domain-containing protein n=1 Tax=Electrophorus electricus TaxID=8005 RepID=A0A4W4HP50_ELEEL|nr:leukocyte receptor cluster member 1 [Electrophorus electricus]
MNILPKKSWHVRNKDNIARVRRDEALAAEEASEIQRRVERAEQEARTDYLRKKSRTALEQKGGWCLEGEQSRGSEEIEHLNLFPLEEASEKKGNAEYAKEKQEEKEKQERAIGLLVSLGPAPGTEATPWYLKDRREREKEKEDERDRKEKGKRKSMTEEEKEKKDRKLKERLDPLMDMRKALAVKDGKEKKHKKKEKRDGPKKKTGESSMERLRAERLQREVEEKRRSQAFLDQRSGLGKEREVERELGDRERPYNSAYFPELARKRQRRDRDRYSFF